MLKKNNFYFYEIISVFMLFALSDMADAMSLCNYDLCEKIDMRHFARYGSKESSNNHRLEASIPRWSRNLIFLKITRNSQKHLWWSKVFKLSCKIQNFLRIYRKTPVEKSKLKIYGPPGTLSIPKSEKQKI